MLRSKYLPFYFPLFTAKTKCCNFSAANALHCELTKVLELHQLLQIAETTFIHPFWQLIHATATNSAFT